MPSPLNSSSISQSNLRAISALRDELDRIERFIFQKLEVGAKIEPGPLTVEVVDGKLIVTNGLKP